MALKVLYYTAGPIRISWGFGIGIRHSSTAENWDHSYVFPHRSDSQVKFANAHSILHLSVLYAISLLVLLMAILIVICVFLSAIRVCSLYTTPL